MVAHVEKIGDSYMCHPVHNLRALAYYNQNAPVHCSLQLEESKVIPVPMFHFRQMHQHEAHVDYLQPFEQIDFPVNRIG